MTSVEFPRDPHLLLHMVRVAHAEERRSSPARVVPLGCIYPRGAWSLHWAFLLRVKAYARLVLEPDVQRELRDFFVSVRRVDKFEHSLIEWNLPNRNYKHRSGFLPTRVRFTKNSDTGDLCIDFTHVKPHPPWGRSQLSARGRDDVTTLVNEFLSRPGEYEGRADFLARLRRCAFDLIHSQYPIDFRVWKRGSDFGVCVEWTFGEHHTRALDGREGRYCVQMDAYSELAGETRCDVRLCYISHNTCGFNKRIAGVHDAGAFVAATLREHAPPSLFDHLPLTENEKELLLACVSYMYAGPYTVEEIPMHTFYYS
jgi:hypothetical protein